MHHLRGGLIFLTFTNVTSLIYENYMKNSKFIHYIKILCEILSREFLILHSKSLRDNFFFQKSISHCNIYNAAESI